MLVLTIRTDKPEAGLRLFQDDTEVASRVWQAHRELAETIHLKLQELLDEADMSLNDIQGIVCYKGPGSFTGLRIGMSVANALACSLQIPSIAANGKDWQQQGVSQLASGQTDSVMLPEYGGQIHITQQKK